MTSNGDNGGAGTRPLALRPDEMMSVWWDERSGTYEWICGPDRAAELLGGGMRRINGEPCRVEVVDVWPRLGGIQLRATTSHARLTR